MAVGLWPARVLACPYCQSETGRLVSAGIFNSDFWLNALLTLLPIPVMLLIVGLIHFGLPWPGRRVQTAPDDSYASSPTPSDSKAT